MAKTIHKNTHGNPLCMGTGRGAGAARSDSWKSVTCKRCLGMVHPSYDAPSFADVIVKTRPVTSGAAS